MTQTASETKVAENGDALARLLNKVEKDGECWTWTGSRSPDGYARLAYKGANCNAHRVAYELLVGPIPDGLVIDHLCRNRACVNPAHLEAVTNLENIRRGENHLASKRYHASQTHCKKGHLRTAENTGWASNKLYRWRYCRICNREAQRARRAAA